LNELEVGWRKMKAAESPEDIMEDAIEMGMANIRSIVKHLQALVVMVQAGNNECLAEPWVQEKLTLSKDYIMAVHDYISSEQNGESEDEEDDAEEENNYYGQSSK
jgi:polyribonucleotide nucleotidyltransferase